MKKILTGVLLAVCSLLCVQAQIGLRIKPVKRDLIPGEPVLVEVTISNQTGRELHLQNVGTTPWITINVLKDESTELPQMRILNMPPLKLAPGKETSSRIEVSQLYDLTTEGMYRAYASVFNSNDGQNYLSNKAFLNIRGGISMWSQTVGAPDGKGSYRYSLLSMSTNAGNDLYAKLEDARTGRVVRCAKLGEWMRFSKPIARIDSANRMHVLFLNTPSIYVHSTLDATGKFGKNEFFKRADSGSAAFAMDGSGRVFVTGGIPYDPNAKVDPIKTGSSMPFEM